jgi:hypothetical protein
MWPGELVFFANWGIEKVVRSIAALKSHYLGIWRFVGSLFFLHSCLAGGIERNTI